ncbi:MAG: MerR family DNA-binding transcriptional regulator [Candidatus Rokubacteria bacterium]|nr:MerR family DNA-binding transcriptional regulator [Candidatus Rokubacteria bacterium]
MRNGNLKIGEAAKRLEMNPRTIRFYESAGLVPAPQRTEHGYASAGHRPFTPQDLRRLQFIRQARLLDLSLGQNRELVELTEDGCCGAARPHLKALIREKLPELRQRIAELRRLERHLQVLARTLPDAPARAERSCDGTVEQCVPVADRPLLQIAPPKARRPQPQG